MDIPPEVQKEIPAVAGGFTALLLMIVRGDRFKHSMLLAISGVFVAHFTSPVAAEIMRSSLGTAGYVTGVFGAAIAAKILDVISHFDTVVIARDMWDAIVKRIRG